MRMVGHHFIGDPRMLMMPNPLLQPTPASGRG